MQNNESSVGPVVATIVILAVIVFGGLYFWSHRSSVTPAADTSNTEDMNMPMPGSSTTTPSTPVDTSTYDANSPMNGS